MNVMIICFKLSIFSLLEIHREKHIRHYLSNVVSRKPEINLPYPKCTQTFIYEFYEIFEVASDPRTEAKCKQCGESVFMMRGTFILIYFWVSCTSSETSGTVEHLS